MDKERKMYTEVYMIITRLDRALINKIPDELRTFIFNKADTSYPYKVDELMPESKALLTTIIKKYLTD